ncbi:MAG: hypothetical protein ACI8R4_003159 [Paracoccaceae bacterium]|jgi:hypothetical protein
MEAEYVQAGARVGSLIACALIVAVPAYVSFRIYKKKRNGGES